MGKMFEDDLRQLLDVLEDELSEESWSFAFPVLTALVDKLPKPRPAPTLRQLREVALAASFAMDDYPEFNNEESERALAGFRASILGDDPEAGQNLAEIAPTLMKIGELVLSDRAALTTATPPHDEGTNVPAALVAHRDAEAALEGAISEYNRRFPDPAGLPDLPED